MEFLEFWAKVLEKYHAPITFAGLIILVVVVALFSVFIFFYFRPRGV